MVGLGLVVLQFDKKLKGGGGKRGEDVLRFDTCLGQLDRWDSLIEIYFLVLVMI